MIENDELCVIQLGLKCVRGSRRKKKKKLEIGMHLNANAGSADFLSFPFLSLSSVQRLHSVHVKQGCSKQT